MFGDRELIEDRVASGFIVTYFADGFPHHNGASGSPT
jgi:hypothetical protein